MRSVALHHVTTHEETQMEKLLLTVEESARTLGIGTRNMYELLSTAAVESVKIGHARRVPSDAVVAYVERLRNDNGPAAA